MDVTDKLFTISKDYCSKQTTRYIRFPSVANGDDGDDDVQLVEG
jgi:hypothetical protein